MSSKAGRGSAQGMGDAYNTFLTARDINSLANQAKKNQPKFSSGYLNADKIQNVDSDVIQRMRGEAYRPAGSGSAWLNMANQNIGRQRDQAVNNIQGGVRGQTQSAWNRMATQGLDSGEKNRTGYQAALAGAFGANEAVGGANQQMMDARVQDELDRQQSLSNAPSFEKAGQAGTMEMAQRDLQQLGRAQDFNEQTLNTTQEIEAARKMGLSYLDPKHMQDLRNRGIKY